MEVGNSGRATASNANGYCFEDQAASHKKGRTHGCSNQPNILAALAYCSCARLRSFSTLRSDDIELDQSVSDFNIVVDERERTAKGQAQRKLHVAQ